MTKKIEVTEMNDAEKETKKNYIKNKSEPASKKENESTEMTVEEKKFIANYVKENKIKDTTEDIRHSHQSNRLKKDIECLYLLQRLNKDTRDLGKKCDEKCTFLKTNQPKLYDMLIKNNSDETMKMTEKMLNILSRIECCEINETQGSYEFGMLCKQIYVDPKINETNMDETLDEKTDTEIKITWNEFKKLREKEIIES
jgi:hypothetical protein